MRTRPPWRLQSVRRARRWLETGTNRECQLCILRQLVHVGELDIALAGRSRSLHALADQRHAGSRRTDGGVELHDPPVISRTFATAISPCLRVVTGRVSRVTMASSSLPCFVSSFPGTNSSPWIVSVDTWSRRLPSRTPGYLPRARQSRRGALVRKMHADEPAEPGRRRIAIPAASWPLACGLQG